MPLTAPDLSPEMKRQLLDQLRNQLGPARYDQLIQARGEDGVVDAVLQAMAGDSSARPGSAMGQADAGPTWRSKVATAVGWVLLGSVFYLGASALGCGDDWTKWAWHWKVLGGLLGIGGDLLLIGVLVSERLRGAFFSQQRAEPRSSSPSSSEPAGFLDLLLVPVGWVLHLLDTLQGWAGLVFMGIAVVIGAVVGPLLLIWGIVDLSR